MKKVAWLQGAVVVATALAAIAVGAVSAQALTAGVDEGQDAVMRASNAKERY